MSFVYLVLLLCMRLLGKRMAAQLTRNELAAVTSLAAGVGLPVVAPDRGMLPAIVICIIVVIATKLISRVSATYEKFEGITQGTITTIVKDGVMNVRNMELTGLTRDRVIAQVRAKQLHQLGEVKALFFEANGNFTLIHSHDASSGLCVLPDADTTFRGEFTMDRRWVCNVCGNPRKSEVEMKRARIAHP